MSEFINNIKFEKNITLKKPVQKTKHRKRRNLYIKLTRLIFLLLVLVTMFYGGRYALCGFVSFCQGTHYQSWEEVKDNWKKFHED